MLMDQPVEATMVNDQNAGWWASALEQAGLVCDEDYEWIYRPNWEIGKVRSKNEKGRLVIHLLWVVYVIAKQQYEPERWSVGKPIPPETLAIDVIKRINQGRKHQ